MLVALVVSPIALGCCLRLITSTIPMTARPATMAATMIPPFAPAESPPPDEGVLLVPADVPGAPELAVELEVGAPTHTMTLRRRH
jgi:hypothetical protein